MVAQSLSDHRADVPETRTLVKKLSPDRFREWNQERKRRENIREGKPYFNGPPEVTNPERHSPSQLLQCQRKLLYRKENAPAEESDPHGIFWFGSRFEEELILPFLEDAVTGEDEYVSNSLWVDYAVSTEVGELRIKGATDPVIVTAEGKPILPTEIKTKESVDNLQEPNPHHEAQLHAYIKGLSERYDQSLSQGVILYGSRNSLDIKPFPIDYDPHFWRHSVLDWATSHTSYRIDNELPPAEPEYSWECKFCSYRERCGQGEKEYEDTGVTGLLPLYTDYPRKKLVEYLLAHDNARLTPSLAHQYPDLAEEFGAFEWYCSEGHDFKWNEVEWNRHSSRPPECPKCKADRQWLRGPTAESQLQPEDATNDQ